MIQALIYIMSALVLVVSLLFVYILFRGARTREREAEELKNRVDKAFTHWA